MPQLKTYLSPVFSRSPAEGGGDQEIQLCPVEVNGRELCWVDELLEGGIEIPNDLWEKETGSPSFILLLAGPPGTGKTTFALEMCYNLARFDQSNQQRWTSLYISSENPGNRIIENAANFGWKTNDFFYNYSNNQQLQFHKCNLYGNENIKTHSGDPSVFFQEIKALYNQWAGKSESVPPDLVVLDSLNVLWPQHPFDPLHLIPVTVPGENSLNLQKPWSLQETFYQLKDHIGGGNTSPRPKLLIVVLDSYFDDGPNNPWEFFVDAAFRFEGKTGPENYFFEHFKL